MSRFLRTLSKIGLVELDPAEHERVHGDAEPAGSAQASDVDTMLRETEALLRGVDAAPAPAPKAAPMAAPIAAPPAAPFAEGRPLTEIYDAAQIPPVPFPAEKLNRLLAGLKAMEPAMRKAAVMAMDAADDHWSITDPLQDAQRKVVALQQAREQLREVVGVAEREAAAELADADSYSKAATEKIRAEIAELEALLQQELTAVAERKAGAQAKLHSTREAAARESARLDAEVSALNAMLAAFAPPSGG